MTQSSISTSQSDIKLADLAKDTVVALSIQVVGVVLTYLVQVFLARWMGTTEYGIYEYVVSWSLILAIPAGVGLPLTVLRLIPEYRVKQNWGSLRGIVRGSLIITLLASLLLCIGTAGILLSVNHYHSFVYGIPLLVGIGLIPLQAFVNLQIETARAMEDVPLAYLPSKVVWPILVLGGGFLLFVRGDDLTSLPIIIASTLALLIAVSFQFGILVRKVATKVEPATPEYSYPKWLKIALSLLLLQGSYLILNQTDIVMVGSLIGPDASGLYNAAVKTAMWVSFILEMINIVAAPAFTTLYTQGDMEGLQKVVASVTIWIFIPSVLIALGLTTFTQPILSLFGPDFLDASMSLQILTLGQVINALCGSVGFLMIMTGYQNKAVVVFCCSALLNIILNWILIPLFGITGAAIATSFTMALWNIWLCILVVRNLGINPTIFYGLFDKAADETN
ncbi:MAG: flippase [Cyanobacteria bacterium P01_F01_bin.143]